MGADTETLLSESLWVRSLARSLAADAQRAEDLAQDTWVAALEGRPGAGVPLRRWIAAVMRNLGRQDRRSELRRAGRELEAARGAGVPSEDPTPDALERLEAHRAVVEAVMGLHEPYRSTVVLRYFDGLPPRAIAERRRIPVRTVHTHLDRARGLLRARLERRFGDRTGAWLPILGLLAGLEPSGGVFGTTLGAVLMDVKIKLAAGAVALAGLFVVTQPLWTGVGPSEVAPAPTVEAAELTAPGTAAPAETSIVEATPNTAREAAVLAPEPEAVAPAATRPMLRGRAIDIEGNPVAGLAVAIREGTGELGESALTDAQGFVDLPFPLAGGSLEAVDERWATVLEPMFWSSDLYDDHVLVVAPSLTLAGMVVDEAGAPLAGATVHVNLPWNFRARLPMVLDGSRVRTLLTESDANGAFELEAAVLPEVFLAARLAGYDASVQPLPTVSALDLRIVLATPDDPTSHVRGTVVDEQGFAVEGARVALAYAHTRSGPDGRFALRAQDGAEQSGVLTALTPGRLPAQLERAGDSNTAEGAWPDPLVLRLGGPPLAIAGRVVDHAGEPVSGATVSILDRTSFGPVEWGDRQDMTIAGYVESLLAAGEDAQDPIGEASATSGEDGGFRLEGLMDRAYRLSVLVEARMHYVEVGPIDAGREDVVLRVPEQETIPRLAGRVLSLAGDPIARANVALIGTRPEGSEPVSSPYARMIHGPSELTDAEGRFEFEDVSTSVAQLFVSGQALGLGRRVALDDGEDLADLEIRMPLRCHVQVDLRDSVLEADEFSILDAEGEVLELGVFQGNMAFSSQTIRIMNGRSEVVSAAEDARTLVLLSTHREVHRQPIELRAGELTVLRP